MAAGREAAGGRGVGASVPLTTDEFRAAMGRFATGVTIVTSRLGEELHGMTANSVTSVSLEPPMVLVCVDRASDSHGLIDGSGVFAVSILGRGQERLASEFAVKEGVGAHRLDEVPHHARVTGAPIIDGSLAYLRFRCSQHRALGIRPGECLPGPVCRGQTQNTHQ